MTNLPDPIDIPAAWYGPDIGADETRWMKSLAPEEIAELERAAERFLADGGGIGEMSPRSFPLPLMGPRLVKLRDTLISGIGFEVLRGLPVQSYPRQLAATIFLGIGVHIGNARSQNASGHILGHVRDTGASSGDAKVRIYQTSERQFFHTDSTDVVGLLCLKDAMEGGRSLLVSSVTIFNEMRRRDPELLACLFAPVATDRRGEVPVGQKPYFEIPVFNWHKGCLTTLYHRTYIDSAQRFEDAPRLTAQQKEALDMFDSLANDPRLHLGMNLQPGDMQFVYNHSLLHDRTGFRDWPDPDDRRHLLRLWLSLPGDRPLPPCFADRYGSIEIGNRGGIVVEGTRLTAVLD
jgi:hypothetical protein